MAESSNDKIKLIQIKEKNTQQNHWTVRNRICH